MKIVTALHTDVGIQKETNQDSLLLMQATSAKYGEIVFAVVCDGMGGLAKGELASAVAVRALAHWFKTSLPNMLEGGFQPDEMKREWEELVRKLDYKITDYGYKNRISLGTTLTGLLIIGQSYYIVHVGDSRIYLMNSQNIYQLTKDQTVVQQEIDQGRLTPQQAAVDPRRSVLLQCVGVNEGVAPEFSGGTVQPHTVFMLCCDGFRHVINPSEFYQNLNYKAIGKEHTMQEKLVYLTELNKQRGETDNISAILVKVD